MNVSNEDGEMSQAEPGVCVEVVAIDDFIPPNINNNLILKRNQRVQLESDLNDELWNVRELDTGRKFSLPSHFLAFERDLVNLQWISYDVSKAQAEDLLMDLKLISGSFIILPVPNHSISTGLKLYVKVITANASITVENFKIERDETGFRVGLSEDTFETLTALLQTCAGFNFLSY
ncbi:hypothetical protein PENTCL1PPCAC_12882 [Pristionchus entomophagus]|uniref:SH2 domain-containing protein n=1 Tax=Pristionchus entomophagus TaxID=358040 RepID=A0AAV5T8J4_9BILA|nr:hypothetical protein PENTCL1PPCAC_12882 [Pristionchus entomophagus]